jgi:hypothetical protein
MRLKHHALPHCGVVPTRHSAPDALGASSAISRERLPFSCGVWREDPGAVPLPRVVDATVGKTGGGSSISAERLLRATRGVMVGSTEAGRQGAANAERFALAAPVVYHQVAYPPPCVACHFGKT